MSLLQLIKELEDQKSTLKSLQEKRHKEIVTFKARFLENIRTEFKQFYSKNGFTISENGKTIRAMYKELNVAVILPQAEDAFFGALSVIDINVTGTIKKEDKILVNFSKQSKNTQISKKTFNTPKNEEDRIRIEIEDTKFQIENYEKNNNLSENSLIYSFGGSNRTQSYENISDLLESIL